MIKPYYQDGFCTIYNADCRDVLPQLAPVDLVCTDPPYGLQWKPLKLQERQATRTDWESASRWDIKPDADLLKAVKVMGNEWIVWGGNYLASVLGDCKSPLVWDKQTGGNAFADGELAFTSFKSGTLRIFRHQWCGAFKDSERGQKASHPTQKPVALMKWCLSFVPEAKTVLDPFMGSGTTLRAAKDLGLKSIGIEIEKKYCDIAIERLRQQAFTFE